MRMSVKVVALCSAVAVLGVACTSGGGSSNSNSPTSGGHLILGTTSNIDTLNPFVTFQQNSYAAFEYIYPQLVQYDSQTFEFKPDFAQSWDTSADGLTWTFHTVPNAKWSDGQPLTANDAGVDDEHDPEVRRRPGRQPHRVARLREDGARRPTTTRSSSRTPRAVANALPELQGISILPQHVWEQYATGDGKGLRQFPNVPTGGQPLVSGGPFEIAEYKKDEVTIFQANPNFYGPKPSIDGFGLQYFSNDDAMVAALQSGQIQAAINVPPTAMATLKENADITAYNGQGLQLRDFIINSSPHKTTNLELLQPGRAHGDGVRDRPERDRADGLARVREARVHDRASRRRRLERPAGPAAAVRHRQGERHPRCGRVRARARRDPRRERPPDELHGAVRGGRVGRRRRRVPDHPERVPADRDRRHAAEDGQRRRQHGDPRRQQHVQQVRPGDVGLVPVLSRARLHPVGAPVLAVRRLERHGLLQQDVRQDVRRAAGSPWTSPSG